MANIEDNLDSHKLCYIDPDSSVAFFTAAPLSEQTGDDWDDAPYQHNAGTPYNSDDADIIKLMFETEAYTPEESYAAIGSVSVDYINSGNIPWLTAPAWSDSPGATLYAGATVREFIDFVHASGGTVYVPYRP